MSKWDESQIWIKLLKIDSEEAKKVRAFLSAENCLSKIQTILSKSGTASKDFTLHDEDHSFRVAERMRSLIPDNTKEILSEYELALILLSAYLHDIGMNPEYNKVQIHYDSLKTDNKLLPVSEKIEFQKWLDDEGWLIDLDNDKIETESEIQEILTAYCRHKHNDWSEEWIRGNFSPNQILGTYTNWMNDLINICRSHHYGLEELKEEKFNPLRINSKVIHIRYLAMCLRLADVIEIDPERAPEVLLKHRNVIEGSISHWLKEKFTSVDVINDSITITANPTKAFIHKAILDVADQIENETILCNTLIKERPLNNIYPTHDIIHSWIILPTVYRHIKEVGNYEFIEGTFRPNTKKLLQLFAGTELYGNPLLAIRELIQNAFNAIKVQIGYKIIEDQFDNLRNRFKVNISITKEKGEYWLTCTDDSVGMDKETIKKCFLISGSSRRRELLELERKCKNIGYDLEITGKFRIGVMSYFMIANKMILETKKVSSQDT